MFKWFLLSIINPKIEFLWTKSIRSSAFVPEQLNNMLRARALLILNGIRSQDRTSQKWKKRYFFCLKTRLVFLVPWHVEIISYKHVKVSKELSLCHKLLFYNSYIVAIWWWKPLIFHTCVILWNRIYSLKYLRSMTLGSKEMGFRKAEFVAKTPFL